MKARRRTRRSALTTPELRSSTRGETQRHFTADITKGIDYSIMWSYFSIRRLTKDQNESATDAGSEKCSLNDWVVCEIPATQVHFFIVRFQPATLCRYKYWNCCCIRTIDFNAFLEQKGCSSGKHRWVPKQVRAPRGGSWGGQSLLLQCYTKIIWEERDARRTELCVCVCV